MNTYLLDACALIAYFNDENGADVVDALFTGENNVVISIVNIYEVYYHAVRNMGEEEAKRMFDDIEELPVKIIEDINKNVLVEAAKFKVNYSMSLADSIALGLAKQLDAYVVTADHHEFDVIENDNLLRFYWIR